MQIPAAFAQTSLQKSFFQPLRTIFTDQMLNKCANIASNFPKDRLGELIFVLITSFVYFLLLWIQ